MDHVYLRVSTCRVVKINPPNPTKSCPGNVEKKDDETKERNQIKVTDDTVLYRDSSEEESDEALDETLNEFQPTNGIVSDGLQPDNESSRINSLDPIINLPSDLEIDESNCDNEPLKTKRISRPPKMVCSRRRFMEKGKGCNRNETAEPRA